MATPDPEIASSVFSRRIPHNGNCLMNYVLLYFKRSSTIIEYLYYSLDSFVKLAYTNETKRKEALKCQKWLLVLLVISLPDL